MNNEKKCFKTVKDILELDENECGVIDSKWDRLSENLKIKPLNPELYATKESLGYYLKKCMNCSSSKFHYNYIVCLKDDSIKVRFFIEDNVCDCSKNK